MKRHLCCPEDGRNDRTAAVATGAGQDEKNEVRVSEEEVWFSRGWESAHGPGQPLWPLGHRGRKTVAMGRQRKCSRSEGDENTEPKGGPRVRGLEEILSGV